MISARVRVVIFNYTYSGKYALKFERKVGQEGRQFVFILPCDHGVYYLWRIYVCVDWF